MHALNMNTPYQHVAQRLLEKKNRMAADFSPDGTARYLRGHTRILDDYFCEQFEQSSVGPTLQINRNPYAVIALGGYGRQEQCLHSDVDVLFLFKKRIPDAADALIREMIYPLWDIGLDIGHATRSLSDCIGLAAQDFEVLTSLLDARFICGMSPLYSELMERVREKILFRRSDKIISWLVETTRERHGLFGDASYLLEPNLKEGQGGLRDYHAMLWIARIKFGLHKPRDLEYLGLLSHQEFAALSEALIFIWNARNCLHRITGRKYDHLHFEYQPRMADMLAYGATVSPDAQKPVERFLSDLHGRMEAVKQKHLIFHYELGAARKWFSLRKKKVREPGTPGITIRRDQLVFASPEAMLREPTLLMRIFEESARLKRPIAPEARRLVREFADLVDEDFRSSREVVRSFERILTTPAPVFNVLNEMLNTGFLARFLPPFQAIINRIQYDAYHVYPVDKHSLRTVKLLKSFADGGDGDIGALCADLYRELPRKRRLLWAALLHDIGKGTPDRDHSDAGAQMARNLLRTLGLGKADVETVAFLIREHLLLFNNATRRDINDEETILFCARRIGDPERLKMLFLLTVADFMATGPKAWNDWVGILVRELFFKVLRALEGRKPTTSEAAARETEALLLSEPLPLDKADLQALFRAMPFRYLQAMPVDAVRTHIHLVATKGDGDFAWEIARNAETDTRTLTHCGRDVPGLFSKIAGALTLNRVNILDAQIHTWQNGLCINIFNVAPPLDPIFESEKWGRIEADLREALAGDLDLSAELAAVMDKQRNAPLPEGRRPNRVEVDNAASSVYTLIEVFTHDEPGVLFRITDALHRCRLDIKSALIATKVDQVVDVFYVQDFSGRKVDDPARVERIQSAVAAVLPGL